MISKNAAFHISRDVLFRIRKVLFHEVKLFFDLARLVHGLLAAPR